MRFAALFVCLLAGCYSPSYRDCEITCASGACPSGFVCDQGVCRVEGFSSACGASADDGGIDGPVGDVDNDRVPDASDNCKTVANTDQANEDGDEFGDACDPCPPFASAADNMDSDGDGVGDGCDPSPTMPANGQPVVNKILVFEGFAGSSAPTGATFVGGTSWTFSGGAAHIAGVALGQATAMATWNVSTNDAKEETVMTRVVPRAIHPQYRPLGVGALAEYSASQARGIGCWEGTDGNQGLLKMFAIPDQVNSSSVPNTLTLGTPYTITLSQHATNGATCKAPNVNPFTLPPSTFTMGETAGVVAQSVDADIEWVMIVTGP